MKMITSFLRDWWHSAAGAYAGGHFHVTAGLAAAVVVAGLVVLGTYRARPQSEAAPVRDHPLAALGVLVGLVAGVALFADRAPAVKPRTVVERRTTIIQHVAAAHSPVSGTDIVLIIAIALVATVAVAGIMRGRS